jgi:hypothetical protein
MQIQLHSGNPRLLPVDSNLPENGNASNLLGRLQLAVLKLQGRNLGCRLLVPGEFLFNIVYYFEGTFLVQVAH